MKLRTLLLWPLSILYGIGVGFRNILFDWGVLKTHDFDIPIICVGNITVGGTGKTPHTEGLISVIRNEYRIACLSRGYKRKTSGFILADEHATAESIGDEPMQIKNKFPEITVAVDGNRVRGIRRLQKLDPCPEVIIMDDGFQHRYVKADINILLMDYNRPIYEDHLLPWGRLREFPSALERANYIIVTKCPPDISPIEKRIISNELKLKAYQELLFTTMHYGEITPLDGKSQCHLTRKSSVLCVTGIARPTPYINYLEKLAGEVKCHTYSDHHVFKAGDIGAITQEFNQLNNPDKYIFVTEKDAVKLAALDIPQEILERIFYIPIQPEFLSSQKTLMKNIHDYVRKDKIKQ